MLAGSDESSADAAAEAAEAAEEAREKAAEAAALAAVAAAAAAVERRVGGPSSEGVKSKMSPPSGRERVDPRPGSGSSSSGRAGGFHMFEFLASKCRGDRGDYWS